MGIGSMFFGDPERRRKEKQQTDLDNDYYQRAKAYNQAKTQEKIRIAKENGRLAAQKEANHKPLYKKFMGVGQAIVKDLSTGNPNQMFGRPAIVASHRRQRRKVAPTKHKRKRTQKKNPYALF